MGKTSRAWWQMGLWLEQAAFPDGPDPLLQDSTVTDYESIQWTAHNGQFGIEGFIEGEILSLNERKSHTRRGANLSPGVKDLCKWSNFHPCIIMAFTLHLFPQTALKCKDQKIIANTMYKSYSTKLHAHNGQLCQAISITTLLAITSLSGCP